MVIADDDATQRTLAAAVVRRLGCRPLVADNGLSALQLIRESGASILVCDLEMPGMDGHELTREVRRMDLGRYIHIIMLTGHDQVEERHRALEAGVDDFMTKPLDTALMTVRLRAAARLIRHEQVLSERNRALEEAKFRIESDLNAAATAQRRLLPGGNGDICGFRFASAFQPSAYVSGDMFGWFALNDCQLGFYAVDVAGHGVHAALMSVAIGHMVTPEYFSGLVLSSGDRPDPALLVQDLNRHFFREDSSDYFAMLCGIVDARCGTVRFCQAGYPHPVLAGGEGRPALVGDGGLPVGLLSGATFENQEIAIRPGDRLVICSDGVTEAESSAGVHFGSERLCALIRDRSPHEATELPRAIVSSLDDWRGGLPLEDDLTVLVLERSDRP
ncbi:PP2C family protein-serine/threonine phosphatase [Paracoccus chinensis]|uniref:PP2C family protein-serine/threonine phosphatase n=1 Tax=Paracoccus chinensis TaxID=525640 RepID=UPI001C31A1F1|nr:SpoIIE family protein phosphatase [Paracoccus chinensis]